MSRNRISRRNQENRPSPASVINPFEGGGAFMLLPTNPKIPPTGHKNLRRPLPNSNPCRENPPACYPLQLQPQRSRKKKTKRKWSRKKNPLGKCRSLFPTKNSKTQPPFLWRSQSTAVPTQSYVVLSSGGKPTTHKKNKNKNKKYRKKWTWGTKKG